MKQQQLTQDGDEEEESPLFPAGTSGQEGAEENEDGQTVEAKAGPSGTGEEPDTLIDEDDLLKRAYENYESGSYSPKLVKFADVEEV